MSDGQKQAPIFLLSHKTARKDEKTAKIRKHRHATDNAINFAG